MINVKYTWIDIFWLTSFVMLAINIFWSWDNIGELRILNLTSLLMLIGTMLVVGRCKYSKDSKK